MFNNETNYSTSDSGLILDTYMTRAPKQNRTVIAYHGGIIIIMITSKSVQLLYGRYYITYLLYLHYYIYIIIIINSDLFTNLRLRPMKLLSLKESRSFELNHHEDRSHCFNHCDAWYVLFDLVTSYSIASSCSFVYLFI